SEPQRPTKPSDAGGGPGGNPSLYEELARVELQVQNTGRRSGQTVIQVYVSFPRDVTEPPSSNSGSKTSNVSGGNSRFPTEKIDFPERVLRNFTKVALAPGESQTVSMTLTRKDLSYWSVHEQNWVMPEKEFYISVGHSSRDLPLGQPFAAY
ncbi:hypothetical protein AOCH_007817, partial [Aspergillus ochraceoroseus]